MTAEKAKALAFFVSRLSELRHDIVNNRTKLAALVECINALIIPRGWVGIDANDSLHVTYVHHDTEDTLSKSRPLALFYSADFVWDYRQWDSTVECIKCRDGSVTPGEVLKCLPPAAVMG